MYVTVNEFLALPSEERNGLKYLVLECDDKTTADEFKKVCTALLDCKQLSSIRLAEAKKLNPGYFQELSETLLRCPELKEYSDDLKDRSDDNIFNAYWSLFEKLKMTTCELHNCDKLSEAQLSRVCNIFSNKPELKELRLAGLFHLDIQRYRMLFESIKKIKHLDLSHNDLGMTDSRNFEVVYGFIKNAPNLSKLDLSYNQLNKLEDYLFGSFLDAIGNAPALVELNVKGNKFAQLSDTRFHALELAAKKSQSLDAITGVELEYSEGLRMKPRERKEANATLESRCLILQGIFKAHATERANKVKPAAEKLTQDGLKESLLCFANNQVQGFHYFLAEQQPHLSSLLSSSIHGVDIDIRLCLFFMLGKLVDKIPRDLEGTALLSAFKEHIKDIQAWDLNVWKLITKGRLSDYEIASIDSMIKKYVEDRVIPALKTMELIGVAELAKETAKSAAKTRRYG